MVPDCSLEGWGCFLDDMGDILKVSSQLDMILLRKKLGTWRMSKVPDWRLEGFDIINHVG